MISARTSRLCRAYFALHAYPCATAMPHLMSFPGRLAHLRTAAWPSASPLRVRSRFKLSARLRYERLSCRSQGGPAVGRRHIKARATRMRWPRTGQGASSRSSMVPSRQSSREAEPGEQARRARWGLPLSGGHRISANSLPLGGFSLIHQLSLYI